MSQMYAPKSGDRVRVVLEGEVGSTLDEGGEFYVRGNDTLGSWVYPARGNVQSVELLAPALPTADGSVVRVFPKGRPERNGVVLIRDVAGDCWRYNDGTVAPPPSQNEDFEIVYTPGKGK